MPGKQRKQEQFMPAPTKSLGYSSRAVPRSGKGISSPCSPSCTSEASLTSLGVVSPGRLAILMPEATKQVTKQSRLEPVAWQQIAVRSNEWPRPVPASIARALPVWCGSQCAITHEAGSLPRCMS
jgi:hypothetical protein